MPGECFIHFLLFLCTGFAIISKAASSPGYLGHAQEREEADITKKGKCTESHRFFVQAEKMTRRELREHCFKMLFSADFYPTQEEAIAQLGQYFQSPEEDDTASDGTLQVVHKVDIGEKDQEYLREKTSKVVDLVEEIDKKIDEVAAGWKTKRMGKVELTILRLAVYEMLYDDTIPEKVSVNEAVELAKKFGGNESPAFVNGVLARFIPKEGAAEEKKAAAEETEIKAEKVTETAKAEAEEQE